MSTYSTALRLKRNDGVNAGVSGFTAATLSTAQKTMIVPFDVDDKIAFVVTWETTVDKEAAQFTIKAGSTKKAWQQGQGDATFTFTATAAALTYQGFLGPFESARFATSSTSTNIAPEGSNVVKVEFLGYQSTKGTSAGSSDKAAKGYVFPFRMPTVQYDT